MSSLKNKIAAAAMALSTAGCAHWDPRRVEVELPVTPPAATVTSYTDALSDLGLMTEIYATPTLAVQSTPIGDNTGTSMSSGGEIPRDVTEIMKSALNAVGGRVIFIPYDPSFMQNQNATGYANFQDKIIPDVVLSGGITEFDRALESRGKNTDVNLSGELRGAPDFVPSKGVEMRSGRSFKSGLSRITLDFNLLDLKTMAGIPRMNVANSMEVRKVLSENELGISLFGQSFGLKGSVKKVQGRHAAVRLLVELSMIQMVGKYLRLPYWRLLGDEAVADPLVLDQIADYFHYLSPEQALANVQEWLYISGYEVPVTGQWDAATREALKAAAPNFDRRAADITLDAFSSVFLNIPLTPEARKRRESLAS
jgi:hypothetical protein